MTTAVVVGLVINTVFLVFHPAWASSYPALLQSFGINAVIFVVPALPFVGALTKPDDFPGAAFLRSALIQFGVLIAVLAVFRLTGWPLTAGGAWNGTWLASNLLLLAAAARGLVRPWRLPAARGAVWLFVPLFVASYGFYFFGALAIVPEQYDHDLEVQATGYGLLTRFEPLLLTDRKTIYYFAHPPLLHVFTAASFLFYGQIAQLKDYDDASQRGLAAAEGRAFTPPVVTFRRVRADGAPMRFPRYAVTGVDAGRYLVSPQLPDGSGTLPVREAELATIYATYARNPRRLESRTPNLFFAALTVALLGCWVASLTGEWWVGLLVALAYATSPEVFVRSSYGGYFAIGSFALLTMMMAASDWDSSPRSGKRLIGFLAGAFAAGADHKLVLFPLSLCLWQCLRTGFTWHRNVVTAIWQPVVAGFGVGTALYWIYGTSINPSVFWLDHVKTHLFDRMLHNNPLGYSNYPSVQALWGEFSWHTGYLLLPLGVLTLCLAAVGRRDGDTGRPLRAAASSWAVYALVTAVVFSWADWRMTKHLMLLLPVLYLAPALWAAGHRRRLLLVSAAFLFLLAWNIQAVHGVVNDFSSFQISPAW